MNGWYLVDRRLTDRLPTRQIAVGNKVLGSATSLLRFSQLKDAKRVNREPLVIGEVTFEEDAPPFTDATMYVYLENITVADIAAEVVDDYVEQGVAYDPNTTTLSFAMAGKALDPRASYSVRVHIDIDGDGKVSQGDFISTQSYPVITFGHPRKVSILVRQIK
jgi:uncharacterized lipoprotein YbaY